MDSITESATESDRLKRADARPLLVLGIIWATTISSFIYLFVSMDFIDADSPWMFTVFFSFGLVYSAPFWMASVVSLFDFRLEVRILFFAAMLFTPIASFAIFDWLRSLWYDVNMARRGGPYWSDIFEISVAVPMIALASSIPLLVLRFQFGQVITGSHAKAFHLKPLSILSLMMFAVVVSICVAVTFFIFEADNEQYWAVVIFASAFCAILSVVSLTWLIPVLGKQIRWVWIVVNTLIAVLLSAVAFPVFMYIAYRGSRSDEIFSICVLLFAGYCWVMLFLFLFRFAGMRLVKLQTRNAAPTVGQNDDADVDPLAPDEYDD